MRLSMFLAGVIAGCAAWGQVAETTPVIVSEGMATRSVQPDVVEFWLTLEASGTDHAESASKLEDFDEVIDKALEEHKLTPSSLTVSGTSIPDVNAARARRSARLRFTISRVADPAERVTHYAQFCDQVREIGGELGCAIEGPYLMLEETQSTEQDAIMRATENALYKGDAVAAVMRAEIYSVIRVAVKSVSWSEKKELREELPDTERITCTARVEVHYSYVAK